MVSLLLCFFYVLGSFQDFLDSTQILLLSLLRISLALQLVCGIWCAGFLAWRNARERRPYLVRWILLVLSLLCCSGLLLALRYVQQWLQS